MDTTNGPISAATLLSTALHGAVVVALLAINHQTNSEQAVGQGLNIELVSSVAVSDQRQTELAQKQKSEFPEQEVSKYKTRQNRTEHVNDQVVTVPNSKSSVVVIGSVDRKFIEQLPEIDELEKHEFEKIGSVAKQQIKSEKDNNATVTQSTNASQQRHTILELLHSSISDNKSYPYLARRQRREGTTTVAFVLYPDGRIENTKLINSSQTIALDRAALSAVEDIEPFKAAQEYLEHAEEFQVNVVFNLL